MPQPAAGLSVLSPDNTDAPPSPAATQSASPSAGLDATPGGIVAPPDLAPPAPSVAPGPDQHTTLGQGFSLWWHNDSSVAAFRRQAADHGYDPDPRYRLPAEGTPQFKALTQGIDPSQYGAFGNAVSAQHAEWIRGQLLHDQQVEQEQSQESHPILEGLGFQFADPSTLALAAIPGFGEAAGASRIGRFLIGGAQAAVENASLTSYLDSSKPEQDGHDVANSILTGFLLGGALHLHVPKAVADQAAADALRARRALAVNEVADKVTQGQLALTDVAPAQRPDVESEMRAQEREATVGKIGSALSNQRDNLAADAAEGNISGPLGQARRELEKHQGALEDAKASADQLPQPRPVATILSEVRARRATEGDLRGPASEELEARETARQEQQAHESAKQAADERIQDAIDKVSRQQGVVSRMERAKEAAKLLKQHDREVTAAGSDPYAMAAAIQDETARTPLVDALKATEAPPESPPTPTLTSPEAPTDGAFGADSASAARVQDVAPAVNIDHEAAPPNVPESSAVAHVVNNRFTPFKTFSSVLRGHKNYIVRSRLGRMTGEALGTKGNAGGAIGASDHMHTFSQAWHGQMSRVEYANREDWMRERGYSPLWSRFNRHVQDEWEDTVGREVRGIDTGSKAAKKAAQGYAELYRHMLDTAKRAGVKGLQDVTENAHYLPRVFDYKRIKAVNAVLKDSGMIRFLADSMEKAGAGEHLDRSAIETVAKAYLQRTKRLGLGVDAYMMHGPSLDDLDYMQYVLRDSGIDDADVHNVIAQLRAKGKRADGEGSVKYTKRRVSFDETHSIETVDEDGKPIKVSIADLWDNHARTVTNRYIRTMAGATGLAKVGITSDSDFVKSIGEAKQAMADYEAPNSEAREIESYASGLYKLLLGRPIDNDTFGLAHQLNILGRSYAYTRSMNMAGFSIFNNLVRPWTNGYARYSVKYLPEVLSMFRRDDNGELKNSMMKAIEQYTGIGTDGIGEHWLYKSEADTPIGEGMASSIHAMKVFGHITSEISGMTPGLTFGQRMMSKAVLERFIRVAQGRTTVSDAQLALSGLDRPMLNRIAEDLKGNIVEAKSPFTGTKIRSINFANMQDFDARDALFTAVNRMTRTFIHGDDIASTGLWMHKWWGKLAIQMRRFPMMAMSKQLGRGLHAHDLDTAMDFMTTGTLGAASMWAQVHLRALGMPEDQRQEYIDKNTGWGRLLAAGIQRNPYSAMFPQMIDSITDYAAGAPVFDARGSGLSTNLLGGIPLADALSNLYRATHGPLTTGDFTQGDARAVASMLPLGNALPVQWVTNALSENLPKKAPKADQPSHEALLDRFFD